MSSTCLHGILLGNRDRRVTMTNKKFRNTSLLLSVFIVISAFASYSVTGDDADWAEGILAFSAAVNPWLISSVVVWSAGEIIGAIQGQDSKPKA